MEVSWLDCVSRARAGLDESFDGGAEKGFLESGATSGNKNDEGSIESPLVKNAFVRAESDNRFGRWS